MKIIDKLSQIWKEIDYPFIINNGQELKFSQIKSVPSLDLKSIKPGDVVAIIGDFNPLSILTLLQLIDLNAIVVPLTTETESQHEYFFDSALVDVVIRNSSVTRRIHDHNHHLLDLLRSKKHAGLILFSTGSTGRPKAILHDLTLFFQRYETPRPTLRTLSFLLFDHIGGLNTLFHTLFNKGVIISSPTRTVDSVLKTCENFNIEVLPTTPTFLRLMLLSGAVPDRVPQCLKVITYGTERMDQHTLSTLCRSLPWVDFRQTFGMSELGILRVKSVSRDSLYMKIGGEGIETKVEDNVLWIKSESRMLGYLNADSPFINEWFNTKDIVDEQNGSFRIIGRNTDTINVGGIKFMPSEVENLALAYPGIKFATVIAKNNPITGQHPEMLIEIDPSESTFSTADFKQYLKDRLPQHMVPRRIRIESAQIGHRYKKLSSQSE
jgi:long-chain acyl-CoA synthetase